MVEVEGIATGANLRQGGNDDVIPPSGTGSKSTVYRYSAMGSLLP